MNGLLVRDMCNWYHWRSSFAPHRSQIVEESPLSAWTITYLIDKMLSVYTALQVTLVLLVSHAHQSVAFPLILPRSTSTRREGNLTDWQKGLIAGVVILLFIAFFAGKYYAVRAKKREQGDMSSVTWEEFWKRSPPKDGDFNGPKSRVRCMC